MQCTGLFLYFLTVLLVFKSLANDRQNEENLVKAKCDKRKLPVIVSLVQLMR